MKKLTRLIIFTTLILLLNISCINHSENDREDNSLFNKQKKLLVGKWRDSIEKPFETSIYEFYNDGTWKHILTYDEKIKITRGKYILGDENEVFLRCFGSQHWQSNKDTIRDIRTSIGIELLFLFDSVLMNNQEDYDDKYRKIE